MGSLCLRGGGQAKDYARMLDMIHLLQQWSGFYEIDMLSGEERHLQSISSPRPRNCGREPSTPRMSSGTNWQPSPKTEEGHGSLATTRTMPSSEPCRQLVKEDRILLTLATGTGKTSIAFQVTWKLFRPLNRKGDGRRPRVLFLADRNILANQAFNSFSAFQEDALCRIRPDEIRKKGRVPMNASIFFTIFQTFMSGDDGENEEYYFGEYPPDFFDLVIIDECHRGGANDESTWRGILEHFSPAVQIGLTATPKRTDNVDTYAYFGEPVYEYSLKQGINDGFLTHSGSSNGPQPRMSTSTNPGYCPRGGD